MRKLPLRLGLSCVPPCVILFAGCTARAPATPAPDPATTTATAAGPPVIAINDNRHPAGHFADGVLTVRLEARDGMWYPDGPDGDGHSVAAWAEEGKPLQNPGPLIRVPAGTEVRATLRNALEKPLMVFGMGQSRGLAADSFAIEPGDVHEVRFRATAPGIYYYAGKTTPAPVVGRTQDDSQLNGAIVVDPLGMVRRIDDRIFLISWWFMLDSTRVSGLAPGATMVINGLSWPHTERFDVSQGDSLHWRWINVTALPHPLHLHGFYFRVDGKGDGATYTSYSADDRRLAVTEPLMPGEAVEIAWAPNRPGNWIFHCHFAGHISPHAMLDQDRRMPVSGSSASHHVGDVHNMAGLVLGIRVKPRGALAQSTDAARPIRLLIRSKASVYGEHVGYSYVLGGSPEEADEAAMPVPGPTLVLKKGEPVEVTIVNKSHEPAAVHWHGIELESFPDGVPGWSGYEGSVLPSIPAKDSLTVRFTPPRAGTFMYHSHFNEFQQIASGLYGAIIVLEDGERYDPERDRVLVFSDAGPTVNVIRGPFPPTLLNGHAQPEPMELRAGVPYRFRLINIRSDYMVGLALREGGSPVEWRLIAKDGATLPDHQATLRSAELNFAGGEIYDFEFTPRNAGDLTLEFLTLELEEKPTVMAVHVR